MKILFSIILLFISFIISGQNEESIYPDFKNKTHSEVVENDKWKILVSCHGNLNSDNQKDLVLILESKDSILEKRCNSCKRLKNKIRIILILINDNNVQRVIVQNNVFIARPNEGGMARYIEPEVSILNKHLNIFYQYTRGYTIYTFEKKNDDMLLIKAISSGVSGGVFEMDNFDFQTMIFTSETSKISEDFTKSVTIPIKLNTGLKKLSEFKEMYEWEVAKNKYL